MGSVSQWIIGLREGDDEAAQRLWERFYERLVMVARSRLREFPTRARDEEDLALSAFNQLCRSARQGKFPRLDDRDNLWSLLVDFTKKKVTSYKRWECALKRGGGKIAFDVPPGGSNGGPKSIDDVVGNALTPDFIAGFNDLIRHVMDLLPDETQRAVAIHKMEGFTHPEIAEQLQLSLRTVERKVSVIQRLWETELNK